MTDIDNIQEVGYAFLKTYYQRMHQDPFKVHHLYSTTAELTHVNYQMDFDYATDTLPTTKLTGKENISKFYTRHSKKVKSIQIKIDGCDFQFTGSNNSSILILALGELCWTNTPSYRFCQSFVLAPVPSNPKIYDVTNDVLRFIPYLPTLIGTSEAPLSSLGAPTNMPQYDYSEELPRSQHDGSEQKDTQRVGGNTSNKESTEISGGQLFTDRSMSGEHEHNYSACKPLQSNITDTAQEAEIGYPQVAESSEISKQSAVSSEKKTIEEGASMENTNIRLDVEKDVLSTDEASVLSSPIHSSELNHNETMKAKSPEAEKSALEPAKKMNWASKLAASESKDVPNVTTKYIRAELAPIQPKKAPERKSVSPGGQAKDAKNYKKKQFYYVNKDGFYPVYVRGTGGVSDEQLVRALESEFGTVRKISSQETFAVIDFEDQRCQTEAIERGVLRINNVEVHMEPKTVRKANASTSTTSPSGQRFSKKHASKRKA
ncbi:LAQU0S09e04280g1_1 [Lachancea quebecensis]|uniref:LAQU0S09e04280g1_1 n=1 Tax=Lachancea quebecensis TaxID=1654605 RepID=A0A0P1KU72_9SACH|nr:LAQU0S09e04280g1_1 [Lachancea quebecensis]